MGESQFIVTNLHCYNVSPGNELVWDVLIWLLIIILIMLIISQLVSIWIADSIDETIDKPIRFVSNTVSQLTDSLDKLTKSTPSNDKLISELKRQQKKIKKKLE